MSEVFSLQNAPEQIKNCYLAITQADAHVFANNGIAIDPDHLEQNLSAHYQGNRLETALLELAKRFTYMASVLVDRAPEDPTQSLQEALTDMRRILTGQLHLVECIIDNPEEAKDAEQTIAALQKMGAHKALAAALSDGAEKPKSKKLS